MSFYNQFMANFTSEEQTTELVKYYCSIGSALEKSLIEYNQAKANQMSDINQFSNDLYQSWLGFFLKKIPNKTAATAYVAVTLNEDKTLQITAPQILTSTNGQYVQQSTLTLTGNGAKGHFIAIQGKQGTYSGTYSRLISFSAPDIDLSTLTVTLAGSSSTITVPEVEYSTSFTGMQFLGNFTPDNKDDDGNVLSGYAAPTDSYGTKGQFYVVISDGDYNFGSGVISLKKGNWILYDGAHWQLSLNISDLAPRQLDTSYAVPYNGYYAFVSDGTCYIRIFQGTDIPSPEGMTCTVSYISTSGVSGETEADTLTYLSAPQIDGVDADITVSNDKSTTAYNAYTQGQLNTLLRTTMYATTSISSVPEYQTWFNSQVEIGDALVYTSYELALQDSSSTSAIDGYVYVEAVDPDGVVISSDSTSDTVSTLFNRIDSVKDIAVLKWKTAISTADMLFFKYQSSSDDTSFTSELKSIVTRFYTISYIREQGLSLFDDLDLALVLRTIGSLYDVVGLTVTGCISKDLFDSPYNSPITTQVISDNGGYISEPTGYNSSNLYIGINWKETELVIYPYTYETGSTTPAVDDDDHYIYGTPLYFHVIMTESNSALGNLYYYPDNEPTDRVLVGIQTSSETRITDVSGMPDTQLPAGKYQYRYAMENSGILTTGGLNFVRQLPAQKYTSYNDNDGIFVEKY